MNSNEDVIYINKGNKKYVNIIKKRSLEELKIEEGTIGFSFPTEQVSFAYMKKLEKIILPKSLESLDHINGFYNCSKLSKIIVEGDSDNTIFHLPDNITKISGPGFNKTSITELNIGKNIKLISIDSIKETKKLESINVEEENEFYSSIDGVLFTKDKKELLYYPTNKKDKEYRIPNTTLKINKNAFLDCNHLKKLIIPSTIEDKKIKTNKIKEIIIE